MKPSQTHSGYRSVLVIALLSSLSGLQAQQASIIVPAAAQNGGNDAAFQVFTHGDARVQIVVEPRAAGYSMMRLDAVSFRAADFTPSHFASKALDCELRVGMTSRGADTLSYEFAKNIQTPLTRVFWRILNLPDQVIHHGPSRFDLQFKFDKPYFYSVHSGNLLLDIRIHPNGSHGLYKLDAVRYGGPGRVFSNHHMGRFALGDLAMITGNFDPYDKSTVLRIEALGLKAFRPAVLMFGFCAESFGPLALPLDLAPLGAPGNRLEISPTLFASLSVKNDPGGARYPGIFRATLPAQLQDFYRFYAQILFLDPSANAMGLVLSNSLQLRSPVSGDAAPMRAIYAKSVNASTGKDLNQGSYGSPVMRFEGVIR